MPVCRHEVIGLGNIERFDFTQEVAELPPQLKMQLDRFRQKEDAPSIVPSLNDMELRKDA
jgi:hypothetical protein